MHRYQQMGFQKSLNSKPQIRGVELQFGHGYRLEDFSE